MDTSANGRVEESYTVLDVTFSNMAFDVLEWANVLLNSFSNVSTMASVGVADVSFFCDAKAKYS